MSSRNLANFVEDEVVDALASAVKAAYPALSHRYYKLKAKWFGVDQLDYWDRNAPLPEDDDRTHPLARGDEDRARRLCRLLARAGDDRPAVLRPALDRRAGAAGQGAGRLRPSDRAVSAHPYLLLNYQGKTRDVMTLAHELGHGVHQVLAGPQGALMADTPLTLAETASVFGEMLTFQALLKQETDPKRRRMHARRQGRGHAEHGGAPDRLLRVRDAACMTSAARAS